MKEIAEECGNQTKKIKRALRGIEYTDISLERVYEYYNQVTDDEVGEACAAFAGKALACREATPEDLIKAMRLYRAIKRIVEEEKLSALTLSCFKLIEHYGYSIFFLRLPAGSLWNGNKPL